MIKSLFVFLGLFLIEISTFTQSWVYSGVINGAYIEPKYSCIDNQNNLYILGLFSGSITSPISVTSYGNNDLILLKYNNNGNLLWFKHIGSSSAESCGGLTTDDLNNIYVSGVYQGTCSFDGVKEISNSGMGDVFLAKYNSNGILQWANRICGASNNQGVNDLKFNQNNALILSGFFRDSLIIGNEPINYDTLTTSFAACSFIAEFNLDGQVKNVKSFNQTYNLSRINKIAITSNGYCFTGNFQQNIYLDLASLTSMSSDKNDAFLYFTDFELNGQWLRKIKGLNSESLRSITIDQYDNIYVLGNYNSQLLYIDSTNTKIITTTGSTNTTDVDTYLAKYNRSGVLQWYIKKGGIGVDYYNDFVLNNNVLYTTGYFADELVLNVDTLRTSGSANQDPFLGVFNEIGDPIGGINIIGTTDAYDAGVIVNKDVNSRAYISGYFRSPDIYIGNQHYSNSTGQSNLFFAIYQQPFKAVITDENMVSCNGLDDGMLTVTPYFGRPPFTYSWSHDPALNNPVAEGLSAGEYTVTITDANDSTASITGEVTQPGVLNVQGLITPVSCNNNDDGAIDITVNGGSPGAGYNFFWTTLDGSGVVPLNEDQTNLTGGTYTVQVVDENQCGGTANFVVTEPSPFSYSGTSVTSIIIPIEPSGRFGQVNLNITGGTSPYLFDWAGPNGFTATSEDIANLEDAGLYDLTVTDFNNCSSDTAIAVTDNFTFVAQIIAKTDVLCSGANNGSAKVRVSNGLAPFSYQWSDGVTLSDSLRTGMQPDNYTVTVTDAAAKTAQASVTISGPSSALTVVLNPDDLICNHDNSGVIDLTVTGGTLPYSFEWNNGYNGEDLVNIPAGTYTVTVTDGNGCEVQDTRIVNEPAAIGLIIVPSGEILCHGERTVNASANATGGTPPGSYSYLWDDPGNQTTQNAFDLGAGTYHCTVTDSNGCSITAEIVILEPDPLSVNANLNNPSCPGLNDGSIIPTPAGGSGAGYEYIWSNGVYQRFNTDIPAGTYILTMNDGNNCVITDTFNVEDPEKIEITSVIASDITCLGKTDGVITITAEGGTGVYSYSTNGGLTFATSPVVSGVAAGDYEVLVTDENDCASESYPVTITVVDTVIIETLNAINPQCTGVDDGTLEITASGGSGIYEYCSDGGTNFVSTPVISSLSAGEYNVIVRDDNDCTSEIMPVSLSFSDTVKIDEIETTDLSCSGLADGVITIVASGGSGIYRYSTDGGESFGTEANYGSLSAGSYAVVVKDENECLSEESEVTLLSTDVCGLIIYDGFSPNNDGKNEVWNIGNAGSFPNIQVKIFNMWGKIVFSSKGYGTPWDGTFNGNGLPAGTYYYVIDPGDGTAVITGDVSIVK